MVQRFGTPRRTLLQSDNGQGVLSAEDILPNEPSFITFSKRGYIKRMKATTFQVQVCARLNKVPRMAHLAKPSAPAPLTGPAGP